MINKINAWHNINNFIVNTETVVTSLRVSSGFRTDEREMKNLSHDSRLPIDIKTSTSRKKSRISSNTRFFSLPLIIIKFLPTVK